MGKAPFTSKSVAEELVREFPKAATLTLAKLAYKRYPALWPNLEAARSSVRLIRGATGSFNRRLAVSDLVRPPQAPGDPFAKLPKALSHFTEWGPVRFLEPANWLVLSDVHVPYHDPVALEVALRKGKADGCDAVLLNGDILDCHAVSFWEKDPRERNFAAELEALVELLDAIRSIFPKAPIVYKWGNHEERYARYMRVKCPEFLDVEEFKFQNIAQLDRFNIQLVTEPRAILLGALHVIHGHEYRFNISNPVNPARGFYLRAKTCVMGGHLHQSSQHSEKTLEGKIISAWSTGCLCNLHPDYSPNNGWNHGNAHVRVTKGGVFSVTNYRVIDGVAY